MNIATTSFTTTLNIGATATTGVTAINIGDAAKNPTVAIVGAVTVTGNLNVSGNIQSTSNNLIIAGNAVIAGNLLADTNWGRNTSGVLNFGVNCTTMNFGGTTATTTINLGVTNVNNLAINIGTATGGATGQSVTIGSSAVPTTIGSPALTLVGGSIQRSAEGSMLLGTTNANAITIGNASIPVALVGTVTVGPTATNFALPVVRGSVGQVLTTDGVGGTSWTTVGGGGPIVDLTMSGNNIIKTGAVGAMAMFNTGTINAFNLMTTNAPASSTLNLGSTSTQDVTVNANRLVVKNSAHASNDVLVDVTAGILKLGTAVGGNVLIGGGGGSGVTIEAQSINFNGAGYFNSQAEIPSLFTQGVYGTPGIEIVNELGTAGVLIGANETLELLGRVVQPITYMFGANLATIGQCAVVNGAPNATEVPIANAAANALVFKTMGAISIMIIRSVVTGGSAATYTITKNEADTGITVAIPSGQKFVESFFNGAWDFGDRVGLRYTGGGPASNTSIRILLYY